MALDPGDAQAHAALATYYMDSGDAARAEAEFDKALRLNPGSADLLSIYAGWASNFGEPEKGVDAAERAMRLNPDTPPLAMYNFAYAYFMVGRYADALRIFDRMPVDAYPPSAYIYRAATLGALGKHEAAKQAVDVALKYNPNLSIETWVAGHASNPDEHERLIDSMRKAGFPVCAGPDAIKAATGVPRLPECAAS